MNKLLINNKINKRQKNLIFPVKFSEKGTKTHKVREKETKCTETWRYLLGHRLLLEASLSFLQEIKGHLINKIHKKGLVFCFLGEIAYFCI